jgi:hypothetical protein
MGDFDICVVPADGGTADGAGGGAASVVVAELAHAGFEPRHGYRQTLSVLDVIHETSQGYWPDFGQRFPTRLGEMILTDLI